MKKFVTEISIAFAIMKVNFAAALSLRTSFGLQIIGMMLNNISFVLVWLFFFDAFGTIRGWGTPEVLAFQGIVAFAFGAAFSGMCGALLLPEYVNNGSFDNFLLSPRSIYWRILSSEMRISAFGDLAFGIILIAAYAVMAHLSFLQIIMLVSLLIPATILMVNVGLTTSLVSFYLPDAVDFAKNVFEVFISPSLYPSVLFPQVLRFIFIFVVPALAVGGLPVEIVQAFSLKWYGIIWLIALVWIIIAHVALARAVRRYESGNLTGARI